MNGQSLSALKRRQGVHVALFLLAVAAGTTGLFHFFRSDLVAYRRGQQALARADFAAAADQLGKAWAGGYQTARVRLDLGRALLEVGRRDEALAVYLAALGATPGDEALLDTIAGLYQAMDQPEKALTLYQRVGAPAQLSAAALARMGDLQQQLGRYEEAITTFRLAAQRAPRAPDLLLRIGIVLAWTGRRGEALEALRSAVALDPKGRLAQLYLARVLLWDGRFAEAVDEYRRGLAL